MKYTVLLLLVLMLGCGGTSTSSSGGTTPPPNGSLASGAWQFNQSQSSNEGTLLDFNLSQSGTQISAVGSTSCFDYGVNQPPYSGPGGLEGVVMDGAPTCGGVSGYISGSSVTLTWNTDTTFTGTLNSNGSITGTTSNNGATNTFTASPVSSLVPNGTYSGTFSSGDIVLTTSGGANYQLSGTMTVNGNGPYSLTGQLLGNILLLSGTVEGTSTSFQMYYDATGSVTGVAKSITVFTNSGGSTMYSGQLTPQ